MSLLHGAQYPATEKAFLRISATTQSTRVMLRSTVRSSAESLSSWCLTCTSSSGEVLSEIRDNIATLSADDASLFNFHFNLVSSY